MSNLSLHQTYEKLQLKDLSLYGNHTPNNLFFLISNQVYLHSSSVPILSLALSLTISELSSEHIIFYHNKSL